MDIIKNFEAMLTAGKDNAMLRFSLGNAYFQRGELDEAISHLARAVAFDPAYSAAWKQYGKALASVGRNDEAIEAYQSGIDVAEKKGDVQAAKEMRVFLKRLEKARSERPK